MTKDETRQAFIAGKMHPVCPRHGAQDGLKIVGNGEIKDKTYWRPYLCVRCGLQFNAAIEEDK